MDLNTLYNRQSGLNLKIPAEATVVGCGGTGVWTAIGLAMSGVKTLVLIDYDTIEPSNLNRLPYTPSTVGATKVDALAKMLVGLRGSSGLRVEKFHTTMSEANLDLVRGTVFCCTDSIASQQLLYRYCKAKGLPYHRVGYDGTVLNISRAYPLVIGDEQPRDGYTVTPSWVVPAAVAGMLGVCSALYSQINIMDDLKLLQCEGSGIVHDNTVLNRVDKMLKTRNSKDLMEILEYYDIRSCDDCGRGDCDNCDRGVCSDCSRYDEGYDRGNSDGYDEGYDAGFAEGEREGRSRGYQEGRDSAVDDAVEVATCAIYEWLTKNSLISPEVTLDDIAEVAHGSRQ